MNRREGREGGREGGRDGSCLQWTLDFSSASSCRGRRKLESMVSMLPIEQRASRAMHASSPSWKKKEKEREDEKEREVKMGKD